MSRVTIRPTLPSDLSAVVGEPLPFRIRALTVVDGDKVLGIGGLGFPVGGPAIAFVQQAADAKKYPVAFHRAGLMAVQMMRETGLAEVLATADASDETALRWLRRLGFSEATTQAIEGRILFVWRRGDVTLDHGSAKLHFTYLPPRANIM